MSDRFGGDHERPTASGYPLPKVTREVSDSLFDDAEKQGLGSILEQAREQLAADNPELCLNVGLFILGVLGPDSTLEEQNALQGVMYMTHELLRRQAEADASKGMFNPPES